MNFNALPIRLSGGFSLRPYTYDESINNSKTDAITFNAFVTDDIRTFLPGLPVFSGTPAEVYFSTLPKKIDYGAGIAYAIRMGDGLVGMLSLDSPEYNSRAMGLDVWSIDFFVLEPFRGRKIILESIYRILETCKHQLMIEKLYASVDKRNTKCIHILERFYFDHVQDDPTGKGALYVCDLSTLRFN